MSGPFDFTKNVVIGFCPLQPLIVKGNADGTRRRAAHVFPRGPVPAVEPVRRAGYQEHHGLVPPKTPVLAAGVLRDSHPEALCRHLVSSAASFLPRFSPHTTCLQAVPLLPKPVTRPNCSASAGIRGHPSGFRVAIQCFARCGPESRARPRTQTDYERLLNGPSGFHSSALLSRATAALEPPRPALAYVLLCRFLQQVPQKPGNLNARAAPVRSCR